jgi:radical SAM superfamily enzyme YgiQ (UPF0313 family)
VKALGVDASASHDDGLRAHTLDQFNAVLISTYELGHQPFGLASPAAWLRNAGAAIITQDLSRQKLDESAIRNAQLVAFYVPMHTATRIAIALIPKVRALNPAAHLCAFGLYAPINAEFLRKCGISTILGGEFEEGLLNLANRLHLEGNAIGEVPQVEPEVSLARQQFLVPDRSGLPSLADYARLDLADGRQVTVGYTEASRGCMHLCRHCPIVPVYNGRFRIVQRDVVLEDIRRQVHDGAGHITFGDPDFFNGIGHTMEIVRALHREWPTLTYDATIKIEHLLKHQQHLPELRDTGCLFVTSAVESVDDTILEHLDKHHTRADFVRAVELLRELGLNFAPTFVAFTPWISLEGYEDLLLTMAALQLIDSVPPIQLAIRLLIPAGSRLLELPEIQACIDGFDENALTYRWKHPDERVDRVQRDIAAFVQQALTDRVDRYRIFWGTWQLVRQAMGTMPNFPDITPQPAVAVPCLTESWFC